MSVKVVLFFGAVVLHKTQCLIFLIRDLHLITTSPHHHIITLSHHHIIPHHIPPRFKANEFRQLCSLKNIMRIKKSLRLKKIRIHNNKKNSALPRTSRCSLEPSKTPSFHPISVNFVSEIIAPRNSYLIPMADF